MAEALLEVVLDNLNSLVRKELASFWQVEREIEKLSSTLTTIKAVLEDAEKKQITNKSLKVWLQKLKDAACVLDDILDECSIKSGTNLRASNQVNAYSLICLNPKNMVFRYKIGKKMKEIRERLDQIAEERQKFHLCEGLVEKGTGVVESRQTCSIIPQPQVYGRDDDRKKIVDFLLSHASDCVNLSIYSIVGIGGVGKTLLAQMVFNDEGVSRHFDLKIWVCVSENFSVIRILQSIIGSILKKNCDITELEAIQKKIRELLRSKRYLLILDDVWNGDQDEWDKLKSILACGSKGASILVTTRLEIVASTVRTIPTSHHLQGLSDDACWSLFKQRALGPNREVRVELVALREEIVKKCGGLPLVANALGGLLRLKNEKREWLDVIESEIWNLPESDNSVLPAFMLSYFNLSLQLRQCFAFCAIFPKDEVINLEMLIHLWMANGYVSSRGRLAMEDIGHEIWNELYQRSFFQDINTDEFGQVESFKMHDLVHDLACSIVGKECVVLGDANLTNFSRSTRHIGYCDFDEALDLGDLKNVESLRTFLLNNYWGDIRFKFSAYHSLRALGVPRYNLSISLGNFIHLRYLDFSYSDIKILPKSIYRLEKLQTLKLERCHHLLQLPKHLRRLKDLRHLLIKGCNYLSQMPLKIGQLTCLKSLSIFIVGSREGYGLAEIRDLELAGELHIKWLEDIASALDARDANLIGKKDLQRLQLSWSRSVLKESPTVDAQQVLEGLQPHSNLKSLTIEYYLGAQFPTWISNLVALEQLQIEYCHELESFPSQFLEGLCSLRILQIKHCHKFRSLSECVKYLTLLERLELSACPKLEALPNGMNHLNRLHTFTLEGSYDPDCKVLQGLEHIPCLRSLNLSYLDEVTCLPDSLGELTTLQTLYIHGCPKLKTLPTSFQHLTNLHKVRISYCDELEETPDVERAWHHFMTSWDVGGHNVEWNRRDVGGHNVE